MIRYGSKPYAVCIRVNVEMFVAVKRPPGCVRQPPTPSGLVVRLIEATSNRSAAGASWRAANPVVIVTTQATTAKNHVRITKTPLRVIAGRTRRRLLRPRAHR
jgi:hypothetical protein